ncbi:carboxypeptidase-like regulatory domain-containing protein [Flavobacterium gelatinilyticum]|uniref:alpha-2-macroglobulin family protein n=1 Tax=Flavobacterium gelatinilyticum TaxID=3003260 RepID=UPI0024801E3A|nr:alpha-2-macroglobulin family protein [Flavobacterium gelatinilyticum]
MKKILLAFLFLSTIAFAQQNDRNWKNVMTFENEGKIKSANEIVEKIYKKAVLEKDEVQMIKCFFFQSKYIQTLEENAQAKIIDNLKSIKDQASIPSKAILNVVYAKCLNDYFSLNEYKIRQRTNLETIDDNFLTWTEKNLTNQITAILKQSLENENILKNTPLTKYELIFDYPVLEKFKKQNLFDFIVKENISICTSRIDIYTFQKNDYNEYKKVLLGESNDFINADFGLLTNERIKTVLQLYQKQEKNNPDLENLWNRIEFCKKYLLVVNEDYIHALNTLQKKNSDLSLTQKIQFEKAVFYTQNASKELHPDYNIKAISLLDSILNSGVRSNAYRLAYQKKENILYKSLRAELQKYTYEQENTRALIRHKNAAHLKISFFKIANKQLLELEKYGRKKDSLRNDIIQKVQPSAAKLYVLKDKKDFFEYSTEVLLPQLKKGSYLVCFESDSDTEEKKTYTFETMTVSNLTALASQSSKGESYQVVDRKTGKPVENAVIKNDVFKIKTNKNGTALYTNKKENYRNDPILITTENDTLSVQKGYIPYNGRYKYEEDEKLSNLKVELYLDRAIYRPGQKVYYKGIAVLKNKATKKVVPNTTFTIIVDDAKGNDFTEFDVTTNEFGSFSGDFMLPNNGLTGRFTLNAEEPNTNKNSKNYNKNKKKDSFWENIDFENSHIAFKVEEYKRPKFEVVFDAKKGNYQINQSVKIKGSAKAFAGSSISNAKVTYSITRFTNYSRRFYAYEERETIAEGETTTDSSGKFTIDFTALPSKNSIKENLPVFNYEIEVSVTDINGETHDAETILKAGYHNLDLEAAVDTQIETKNKNVIKLHSTNLNDEFLAAKGELKIYFVNPSSTKFKTRIFNKPDFEDITKEDFEQLFPFENNENPKEEIKETLVYSKNIDTEKDKILPLDFISDYKSGNYKIVFSAKDSYDNLIEDISNVTIKQSRDKFDTDKLFTVSQINTDPKKDGFVQLKITSVIPELYITATGSFDNNVFSEETYHLKNNETMVKIPIQKEFQNALTFNFESVFENEKFNSNLYVFLKSETPELKFDVQTFRNKLEPGIKENWSFKLNASGTKNEAEILASMYDSSLDQFTKQNWNLLNINDSYSMQVNTKSMLGSQKLYIPFQNLNKRSNRIILKDEALKLIWFGFNFNTTSNSYKQQQEYQKQLNKKIPKPANAKMISGIITDQNNEGLPGVSITVKGTQRMTSSDFDGYYEIEAAPKEELIFSYLAFDTESVKVGNKKTIDISLIENTSKLQEVVVTAYGTQKKKSMTASVVAIKSQVIEEGEEDEGVFSSSSMAEMVSGMASGIQIRGAADIGDSSPLFILDGKIISQTDFKSLKTQDILDISVVKDKNLLASYGSKASNGVIIITTKNALEELNQVKARKNLSETAFFFPDLRTDAKGKVSFNFTSPESLTAWKLRLLAHNKDAVSGYLEKSVITQKEIMVMPNLPRFLREKDTIVISAKISNVTAEAKTGIASLQFFDAVTMEPIDAKMLNAQNIKNFTIPAYGNTIANWKITIPEGLQGVQYKIAAKAGNFSDGEESIIPVLTNTMLVTESIPVWVRENSAKEYTFENLKNNTSTTLRNHLFTFEYTSNPTWLAIQSLPYLMEYEHECAEQTFARFYANALATEIISNNPKIAAVFEEWRKKGKPASKLEENEELKSLILAETPWIQDAQNEDEKKKNLSLLFDLEKMKSSQESIFEKLKQKQKPSGGFSWFDGSDESEYITRHILAGLGHLERLSKNTNNSKIEEIAKTGIPFIDRKFLEYHQARTRDLKASEKLIWFNPYSDLHYLYTRSFYLEKYPLSDTLKKATKLYLETAKKDWLNYSIYEKGLAALTLNRFGEKDSAKKILESLKETSSNNEDWGMYWIANKAGWYWYQAPIETQALLIEAFAEINNDTKSVDAMKVWLLKNKQTKNWPTTKSTTEAVYALLMQGTGWLSIKDNTIIKLGDEKIMTKKLSENEKEAETGYIKLNWKADEIKKEMASIKIENKSKVPGYGGVYWQYFEDLEKIKNDSGSGLNLSKELYLKKNTLEGNQLEKITAKNHLKTGDLVTVRLIITAREDVEYIHLKDMRASCFEPVNVLSEYKYKDGLGYYMSTKDAATHFFFDRIKKGTYILEYDIRVNNSGEFSNGITTIQSMYAPEFASHTKGIRVTVD